MQVQRVKISELQGANYNPASRTQEGATGLRKLAQSIERIGLIYPVSVSKNMQIIDGHRRVAACQLLGWTEIPVLISEGDPDQIYADVNSNNQKLNGVETLQVWLKKPEAVTGYTAKVFASYEEQYGRATLEYLIEEGCSVRPLQAAISLAKYVDDTTAAFVRKATKWTIKYRAVQIVMAYIRLQQSPATIYKAVQAGKELKTAFRSSK